MSEQLQVIITGKDGVSRIFQEISKSAKTAGDAVESAGKDGAAGLKQIDQAADKTKQSVDDVGESAQKASIDFDKFGAAAIAIGGFLTIAGNSALDQKQTIVGLTAAYGDAADEMLAFADQMASTTIFNDDDIMRGERYFATLKNNYDLSIDQVQQLMQTTADLASAYGTSFEDASSRITAAIRGEGEAAEFLGLTMNQQAIDRENLTLTMSNQEAAAFRLNALYAQTDVYAGTAAALVETEVGQRAKLTNAIQDNTQAVANFIGPYNAIIAGAATGAVGLAQFAGGFGSLATGIKAATLASRAFVTTPVGAAVVALGLGIGVVTKLWMDNRAEAAETAQAWEDAAGSAEVLAAALDDLSAGNYVEGQRLTKVANDAQAEFEWLAEWLPTMVQDSFGTGDWFDEMVRDQLTIQGDDPTLVTGWNEVAKDMLAAMTPDETDSKNFTDAMANILTLEDVLSPELWRVASKSISGLFDAFNAANGAITVDAFNASLVDLFNRMTLADKLAKQSTVTNYDYSDAMGAATISAIDQAAALRELALAQREVTDARGEDAQATADRQDKDEADRRAAYDAETERRKALFEWRRIGREEAAGETAGNIAILGSVMEIKAGYQAYIATLKEGAAAYKEIHAARQDELQGMLQSLSGLDNPLDQWNATSGASPYSQISADATNAASALDNLERIVISNTDAFASQSQGIADWATQLIGAEGEVAKLDDAYQRWIASGMDATEAQLQYNAAQDAATSIFASNAAIQEHVTDIQLAQAPLIAESTAALEDQLGVIAGYEPALQLTALAWMDSATAAKAMEIATMATAVANGELGASGEAAFTSYLTGLAQVDPAMKALLVDMKLIEVGANGEITVTMDGAEGAISDMDRLTSAIIMLLDFMDDQVINGSVSIDGVDEAVSDIERVQNQLIEADGDSAEVSIDGDNSGAMNAVVDAVAALLGADGDSATVYVNGVDNASGIIGSAQAALNGIDGRVVTAYINTVYSGRTVGETPFAMGGIAGYAMGGNLTTIQGGEAGYEFAHFATGGTAMLPSNGLYSLPTGTYIEPHNSAMGRSGGGGLTVQIDVHGNIYGVDDLAAEIIGPLADKLTSELERNRVAAGVLA